VQHPLQRVALTGGIATGKSVCLHRFSELGAPVIDADVVAREVVAPGTPALSAVVARFGPAMLLPDGSLDRATLGRLVFAEAGARADLERIVHPAVYEVIERWIEDRARAAAEKRGPRIAIADIPLLYETGQERRFDRVVVAACSPREQLERLMARDAMTEAEARRRIAAQWPIDHKRARAHIVIDTSGSLAETTANVDRAWQVLTG
jgi:dephospho-CoA kinase